MSRLSSLNNRTKSPDNELHLNFTSTQIACMLRLLPDKISRTRFINHYHLPPLQETPEYIQIPTQYPLWQAIEDRLYEEKKDYEIVPIDKPVRTFLNSHEFTHDLKIGYYSATDRANKIRYVTQIPFTITDYARTYLQICQELSGNKLKRKYNKHKDICHATNVLYFSGYYEGKLAYIDIKAAYWSILWPTTMDMEYDPVNQEIAAEGNIGYWHCDQFMKSKRIRQIVHSLFNYREMKTWEHENQRIRRDFPPAEIYRPYNLWYILDVMNAIVNDAINQGFTIYQWLTDAAIIPANQAEPFMEFLFERWFLASRLKWIGDGVSNQMNMYKVGPKLSGGFNPKRKVSRIINTIRPNSNIEGLRTYRLALINGEIPIVKSKRQPKMFGIATKVIQPSEFIPKPKKRLIAGKRPIDSMKSKRKSPPPTNTIDATEFLENWKKRQK